MVMVFSLNTFGQKYLGQHVGDVVATQLRETKKATPATYTFKRTGATEVYTLDTTGVAQTVVITFTTMRQAMSEANGFAKNTANSRKVGRGVHTYNLGDSGRVVAEYDGNKKITYKMLPTELLRRNWAIADSIRYLPNNSRRRPQ